MNQTQTTRPTKKQRELLEYIGAFINEHGYSPSYREIMRGLNYTSVATVALHVKNLIDRGHLVKRDRSARSLEVVSVQEKPVVLEAEGEEAWLVKRVEAAFAEIEAAEHRLEEAAFDHLYVLTGALKVLGYETAAQQYIPRLQALRSRD